MDLEGDLGIDSIKRVEIFSTLSEKFPSIEKLNQDQVSELKTLGSIIKAIEDGSLATPSEDTSLVSAKKEELSPFEEAPINNEEIPLTENEEEPYQPIEGEYPIFDNLVPTKEEAKKELEVSSAPTIQKDIAQESVTVPATQKVVKSGLTSTNRDIQTPSRKPTIDRITIEPKVTKKEIIQKDISLPKDSSIWITDDGSSLAQNIAKKIEEKGYQAKIVSLDEVESITPSEKISGLLIVAPKDLKQEDCARYHENAFLLLQKTASKLKEIASEAGSNAVFATVTRMGGTFGIPVANNDANYLSQKLDNYSFGGLSGLSKTASHEWPEVECKALDISDELNSDEENASEIAWHLFKSGFKEVGILNEGDISLLELKTNPIKVHDIKEDDPVALGDIFIVTGGLRGVTAEITITFAQKYKPTLFILGRSEPPQIEESWLVNLTSEKEIKAAILHHSVDKISPKQLEQKYKKVLNNREMLKNMARIKKAGAVVIYRSCDVKNKENVSRVVSEIKEHLGPIRGVIHGAGVLNDRLIEDKTIEQFKEVYETKVVGFQNLFELLDPKTLSLVVLFSSSTGRYGRRGQIDYAIANETLNKLAQYYDRALEKCRVTAINWGPWDGGMVTPALKKIFHSEGIDVIPLQEGADYLTYEVSVEKDTHAEIVILGSSPDQPLREDNNLKAQTEVHEPLSLDVSTETTPVLLSHVIGNKPVVPVVLSIEWLVKAALQANPNLTFHGFDNLQVLKGIILDNNNPKKLEIKTSPLKKQQDISIVDVEIYSRDAADRTIRHVVASVVLLDSEVPNPPAKSISPIETEYPNSISHIYNSLLFHGKELQGLTDIAGVSDTEICISSKAAPAPASWIKNDSIQNWLTDPLVIDTAFQAIVIWTWENCGQASLPCAIRSYRQYSKHFPKEGCQIVASATQKNTNKANAKIEFVDKDGNLIAVLDGYEAIVDNSLYRSFRRNQIEAQTSSN